MRFVAVASLLLLAGAAALVLIFDSAAAQVDILPREFILVNGNNRWYRLVTPPRLDEPAPIVFAFHGVGESPEEMATNCQWDALAARDGFVLVYPAAERGMWRTVELERTLLDEHPDLRFFDALLEDLSTRFPIDKRRVYLLGMSNGATFAQLLADERRQHVAAVVAHSGPRPSHSIPRRDAPRLMLLVGAEDSAQATIRKDAEAYQAAGREVEFVLVPSLGHAWSVKHNAVMRRFLWSDAQ